MQHKFNYVPETGWPLLPALTAGAAIAAASYLAAELASSLFVAWSGMGQPGAALGTTLARQVTLNNVTTFGVVYVMGTALTLIAARQYASRPLGVLALRVPQVGAHAIARYFIPLFAIAGVGVVALMAWQPEVLISQVRPLQTRLLMPGGLFWLPVLLIAAPVAEELFFRGYLFSALAKSRAGLYGATFITSAAWSLAHVGYSWHLQIAIFCLGLYLSYLLLRTGSLWVPLAAHVAYNAAVIALLFGVTLPD